MAITREDFLIMVDEKTLSAELTLLSQQGLVIDTIIFLTFQVYNGEATNLYRRIQCANAVTSTLNFLCEPYYKQLEPKLCELVGDLSVYRSAYPWLRSIIDDSIANFLRDITKEWAVGGATHIVNGEPTQDLLIHIANLGINTTAKIETYMSALPQAIRDIYGTIEVQDMAQVAQQISLGLIKYLYLYCFIESPSELINKDLVH